MKFFFPGKWLGNENRKANSIKKIINKEIINK